MLEETQIVSVHAKAGIFFKVNSVVKQLSWRGWSVLAWKWQKRKAWVLFSFLSSSCDTTCKFRDISFPCFSLMHGNWCGVRVSVTSHGTKQPEGSPRPAPAMAARCLLCLESSRGWAGFAATMCLCEHLPGFAPCQSHQITPVLLLVIHPWSSQDRGFLLQHPWLFLPSKHYFCLLAALPVCVACAPVTFPALLCSRLLFSAATILTPPQNCRHRGLGRVCLPLWSGLLGHCLCVCQLVPKQLRAHPSWTGVYVACYRQKTRCYFCVLHFLYGMALSFFCPHPLLLLKSPFIS